MSSRHRPFPAAPPWWVAIAVWSLVALVFAANFSASRMLAGRPVLLATLFAFSWVSWSFFVLLTAVAAWLVRRFPLAAGGWRRGVAATVAAAAVLVPAMAAWDVLDSYLESERMRFPDRLRIVREVEPAALAAAIPPLTLQPIVENAVRHGIAPRADGGTVTIRAWVAGGALRVEIADDGVGFDAAGGARGGQGLGLRHGRRVPVGRKYRGVIAGLTRG